VGGPGRIGSTGSCLCPSSAERSHQEITGAERNAPAEEPGGGEMEATKTPLDIPELERLEPIHTKGLQRVFALLRVAVGWTFLWAFLDKAFALGFSTGRVLNDAGATVKIDFFGDAAWIHGASPTAGVLGFALKGPFTHFYQTITGYQMTQAGPTSAAWVDWIYMLSMLLIGLALILGVGVRLASIGGIVWMVIFFTAT